MGLKENLEKQLKKSIADLNGQIRPLRRSLKALESMNLDNATYFVSCDSAYEEESRTIEYKGSLAGAMRKAKEEFKDIDVRARNRGTLAAYSVDIFIGEDVYPLSEELWEKYKRRH